MTIDRGMTYRSVWSHMMTVPFRQDFVEAGGLRTRFVEAGRRDAPPLVLLHGTGGHWEAFAANIGPFAEHYRVLAPDMMGCGFTDKPDHPYEIAGYVAHVRAFMDVMGVARAGFVGVSLGSWVAVRLALDSPERVDRMVLVAPSGYYGVSEGAKSSMAARRATAENPTWENTRTVLGKLLYDPAQVMDDLIAVRQRVYSLPDMDRIMPRMLTLFDPEIRARNLLSDDQWKRIAQPALLIENVDADDVYLKTARTVAALMPNARLAPIPRVSHWAQFEDPATFNRLALEFLAGAQR